MKLSTMRLGLMVEDLVRLKGGLSSAPYNNHIKAVLDNNITNLSAIYVELRDEEKTKRAEK